MSDAIVDLDEPAAPPPRRPRRARIALLSLAIVLFALVIWGTRPSGQVAAGPTATPLACHPEEIDMREGGADQDNWQLYAHATPAPLEWASATCIIRASH